jgi:ferredoxin/flavodoxin---NADP+ reductase
VEDDGIGHFVLETSDGDYASRTIVIAAGIGAFEARRLGIEGEDQFEEKGLYFKVLDPRQFEGKRVLLVGGGDSAFDWAVNLQGVARSVMLIHRRDGFRAHQATINQVQELDREGRCELRTFCEVKALHGNGKVEAVTIRLKLIATGASEACIAVNNAVHYINPKPKVNPGHSSNLAIFGQSE